MKYATCLLCLTAVAGRIAYAADPFLIKVNNSNYVIGNDHWNVTIGPKYGTKLMYKGVDLVKDFVGHYVSYSM